MGGDHQRPLFRRAARSSRSPHWRVRGREDDGGSCSPGIRASRNGIQEWSDPLRRHQSALPSTTGVPPYPRPAESPMSRKVLPQRSTRQSPSAAQVAEPLIAHGLAADPDANRQAVAWLARLGLPDPLALARRYPHEISGGQQQRVMIAMALASEPDLVVLDEPTTALDVTTQLGVLHAVKKVIREAGMAAIYVSHNLAVVSQVAGFVVVVREGEAVEMGDVATILTRPRATHTKALLRAVRRPPRPKAFPNATASPYPSPHPDTAD